MKKTILIIASFAFMTLMYSCSNSAKKVEGTQADTTKVAGKQYACPMHPDKKSDKPGKCSECGMDMEVVK